MGRPKRERALTSEQISEVLANFDLECASLLTGERQLARLERSAQRCIETARIQMEARQRKIPAEVGAMTLRDYYDMHAATAAAEHGRHMPPLALASMPDVGM